MASKRMFDKAIVDTDKFCDMPMSAKALYFILGMEADDYGFVSPRRVMRMHGGSDDDLKVLVAKEFLIQFESGVIVITDWHKNNVLRKERVKVTEYQNELRRLCLDGNKYLVATKVNQLDGQMADNRQTNDGQMTAEISLVEVSLDKISLVEESIKDSNPKPPPQNNKPKKTTKRFKPPTVEEVHEYCISRANHINPESFVDFYESKGWQVGKNKMKDWKAAVRTWERRDNNRPNTKQQNQRLTAQDVYNIPL